MNDGVVGYDLKAAASNLMFRPSEILFSKLKMTLKLLILVYRDRSTEARGSGPSREEVRDIGETVYVVLFHQKRP
jgi:hypothetical protein